MLGKQRRKLLKASQAQLMKELDVLHVLFHFLSFRVFDKETVFNIMTAAKPQSGRRRDVIKLIRKLDATAYDALYKALLFSQQEHLAALLRPQVSAAVLESEENKKKGEEAAPKATRTVLGEKEDESDGQGESAVERAVSPILPLDKVREQVNAETPNLEENVEKEEVTTAAALNTADLTEILGVVEAETEEQKDEALEPQTKEDTKQHAVHSFDPIDVPVKDREQVKAETPSREQNVESQVEVATAAAVNDALLTKVLVQDKEQVNAETLKTDKNVEKEEVATAAVINSADLTEILAVAEHKDAQPSKLQKQEATKHYTIQNVDLTAIPAAVKEKYLEQQKDAKLQEKEATKDDAVHGSDLINAPAAAKEKYFEQQKNDKSSKQQAEEGTKDHAVHGSDLINVPFDDQAQKQDEVPKPAENSKNSEATNKEAETIVVQVLAEEKNDEPSKSHNKEATKRHTVHDAHIPVADKEPKTNNTLKPEPSVQKREKVATAAAFSDGALSEIHGVSKKENREQRKDEASKPTKKEAPKQPTVAGVDFTGIRVKEKEHKQVETKKPERKEAVTTVAIFKGSDLTGILVPRDPVAVVAEEEKNDEQKKIQTSDLQETEVTKLYKVNGADLNDIPVEENQEHLAAVLRPLVNAAALEPEENKKKDADTATRTILEGKEDGSGGQKESSALPTVPPILPLAVVQEPKKKPEKTVEKEEVATATARNVSNLPEFPVPSRPPTRRSERKAKTVVPKKILAPMTETADVQVEDNQKQLAALLQPLVNAAVLEPEENKKKDAETAERTVMERKEDGIDGQKEPSVVPILPQGTSKPEKNVEKVATATASKNVTEIPVSGRPHTRRSERKANTVVPKRILAPMTETADVQGVVRRAQSRNPVTQKKDSQKNADVATPWEKFDSRKRTRLASEKDQVVVGSTPLQKKWKSGVRPQNSDDNTRAGRPASHCPIRKPGVVRKSAGSDKVLDLLDLTVRVHKNDMLGEGGFAMVFLASEVVTGKKVAVKILPNSSAGRKEKEILADIKTRGGHPNLVEILGGRLIDGSFYLAMELLGPSLMDILNDIERLSVRQTATFLHQMTTAVDFLHSANICHGDVKPDNILTKSGVVRNQEGKVTGLEHPVYVLVDFNTALRMAPGREQRSVVGTTAYRAPEIVMGLPWTNQIDIFSLGLVVSECFDGELLIDFEVDDVDNLTPKERVEHLGHVEAALGTLDREQLRNSPIREIADFGRRYRPVRLEETKLQKKLKSMDDVDVLVDDVFCVMAIMLAMNPKFRPTAKELLAMGEMKKFKDLEDDLDDDEDNGDVETIDDEEDGAGDGDVEQEEVSKKGDGKELNQENQEDSGVADDGAGDDVEEEVERILGAKDPLMDMAIGGMLKDMGVETGSASGSDVSSLKRMLQDEEAGGKVHKKKDATSASGSHAYPLKRMLQNEANGKDHKKKDAPSATIGHSLKTNGKDHEKEDAIRAFDDGASAPKRACLSPRH